MAVEKLSTLERNAKDGLSTLGSHYRQKERYVDPQGGFPNDWYRKMRESNPQ
jgi:hypothetical protein